MMQIKNLVECQLDYYRNKCNFTDEELAYFNYKARDYSNTRIGMELNVSHGKVNLLSKAVRNKMGTVDKIEQN